MAALPYRRRRRPARRVLAWLCLAVGVALIGYVGFAYADARLFQAYHGWRLERALASAPAADRAVPPQVQTASSAWRRPMRAAPVAAGSALGRLRISRIGIDVMVAEGVDRRTLRRAVGHIPGTALPGDDGNVALTGHRDTFFRALRHIRQDDAILLTTLEGTHRYRVDSMQVVAPEDTYVLDDTGDAVLTLVTCYPFYFVGPAPQRFIVRAHRE